MMKFHVRYFFVVLIYFIYLLSIGNAESDAVEESSNNADINGGRYIIITNLIMNYNESMAYCKKHFSQLAIFNTLEDFMYIVRRFEKLQRKHLCKDLSPTETMCKELMAEGPILGVDNPEWFCNGQCHFWIGLSYNWTADCDVLTDCWMWSDGSRLSYSDVWYGPTEPNNLGVEQHVRIVIIAQNHKDLPADIGFGNQRSSEVYSLICMRDGDPNHTSTITSPSSQATKQLVSLPWLSSKDISTTTFQLTSFPTWSTSPRVSSSDSDNTVVIAAAVAGGGGGLLIGVSLGVIITCICLKRKRDKKKNSASSNSSSDQNSVQASTSLNVAQTSMNSTALNNSQSNYYNLNQSEMPSDYESLQSNSIKQDVYDKLKNKHIKKTKKFDHNSYVNVN